MIASSSYSSSDHILLYMMANRAIQLICSGDGKRLVAQIHAEWRVLVYIILVVSSLFVA